MSAAKLGVNEHHQAQIINYMRFARYQRGQRLREVNMCFDNIKSSRLTDTTFTIDEVTDMFDSLLQLVIGAMDSELINTAHTNVLLLRQMFIIAEKWHLKLQADISELENRELLEHIADFEDQQFAGTKLDHNLQSVLKNVKLSPLNESGGTQLLHMKIEELEEEMDRLQVENRKTKERLAAMGGAAAAATAGSDMERGSRGGQGSGGDVDAIKRKMANLEADLDQSKRSGASSLGAMESDLSSTKHELLRIREMLEMAEKELEKKVHQTAPFKNLKQMLMKKNDQLKDLRKRLSKYEKVSNDD